jgi:hypothetical protein
VDERRGEGCCERVAFMFLDEGGLNVGELRGEALVTVRTNNARIDGRVYRVAIRRAGGNIRDVSSMILVSNEVSAFTANRAPRALL